jgi:hypothetical protein
LEILDTIAHTNGLVTLTGAGDRPRGTLASPRISDDGRFIIFLSDSPDLPGAKTNLVQLYRHDRTVGATVLVSSQPAGEPSWEPFEPRLNSEAGLVAYLSTASHERSHAFVLPLAGAGAPEPTPRAMPRAGRSTFCIRRRIRWSARTAASPRS